MSFKSRVISNVFFTVEQSEGMGARVRRSIGIGRLDLINFDPFLLFDEFKASAITHSGFPDHPHRGFETVTYMLPSSEGSFRYEDFHGHNGTIRPGGLKYMNAGRGMVHSEMPYGPGIGHGLQLWVNLHSNKKMSDPAYGELSAEQIATVDENGVTAIIIVGEAFGNKSTVTTKTPMHYIHFIMKPNTTLKQRIPADWSAFIYVLGGKVDVGDTHLNKYIGAHNIVTLSVDGDGISVGASEEGADFVLISGEPIGEPVVQHGTFVMNTQSEILEAFDNLRNGKNGFEKAPGWESELGKVLGNKLLLWRHNFR